MIGVDDLKVKMFSKDGGGEVALIGAVSNAGNAIADDDNLLEAFFVEAFFSSVGVDIGDLDVIATPDFQSISCWGWLC